MKKTITTEEALAFLNLCAANNPRATTELLNNGNVAEATRKLFNDEDDKSLSIQINRNKTGAVIGFEKTKKAEKKTPEKKTVADPRPKIFKGKDDSKKVSK